VSFDDTKVLSASLGECVVLAKRSGNNWYVGAATDWTPRDLSVDLSFLGDGEFQADLLKDGADADSNAESYRHVTRAVNQHTKLRLHLASGGGAVIKIYKASI
jgi:alpha-glucosidase